ncbi:hypothetical protein ACE6H2_027895 [Prunus campanulata]
MGSPLSTTVNYQFPSLVKTVSHHPAVNYQVLQSNGRHDSPAAIVEPQHLKLQSPPLRFSGDNPNIKHPTRHVPDAQLSVYTSPPGRPAMTGYMLVAGGSTD